MQKTSEVYEKLYHYTTWDGLLGIIGTKTLWATHYKFLNDYSEIVLFRDKLISFLFPYVHKEYKKLITRCQHIEQKINQSGGLDQNVQHDTEVLVDAQYKATGDNIYILSFCGQHKDPKINSNGLLSQWQGYGTGGGFALVFDTQKLEEIAELELGRYEYSAGHMSDLVYNNDEKKLKEELSEDLSILADFAKEVFNHMTSNKKEQEVRIKGYKPFINCITRYKHYGFKEENEVRIVVLPTIFTKKSLKQASSDETTLKPEKEIKFRYKNEQLIPYIELFNSADIDLPIERIIVGPHKEKEIRASTLSLMLRKTKIQITCSDIPYVG